MALHRFFATAPLDVTLPAEEPLTLPLTADDVHHAVHVLRLGPGDTVELAGQDRRVYDVKVTDVTDEAIVGHPLAVRASAGGPEVTLFQGLAKGDKLDLVVEKAVEVGAAGVVPVGFERSVVRLSPERARSRGERLRRVAEAAAKQSHRDHVPAIADPVDERELLPLLEPFDVVLVPWEDAASGAPGIGEALSAAQATGDSRVAVIVGPEGGLTDAEVGALQAAGAVAVSLGETVLRTETAGIVALALCIYEMGGLGGTRR